MMEVDGFTILDLPKIEPGGGREGVKPKSIPVVVLEIQVSRMH